MEDALPGAAAAPSSPESVLERAFNNQYDCDTTGKVELVMRSRNGGERRRLFQAASKRVDGRLRSLARLMEPEYLRDMTIMTVERPGRSEETFVYLPALRKVRRITSAQRADSFLGSDLTYEDIERRRVDDFLVDSLEAETFGGEPAYRVRARPRRPQSYDRIEFVIAQTDRALLAVRYFKRGAEEPFRVIEALRAGMIEQSGHVLPTRLTAYNTLRGTSTEIVISDLRVNPEIDDQLFSMTTLERRHTVQ